MVRTWPAARNPQTTFERALLLPESTQMSAGRLAHADRPGRNLLKAGAKIGRGEMLQKGLPNWRRGGQCAGAFGQVKNFSCLYMG